MPCVDGSSTRALSLGGECLQLSARVLDRGTWTALPPSAIAPSKLADGAVSITLSAPTADAFEIVVDGARGASFLQQGYQSWSFSGAVHVPRSVPRAADGSLAARAAFTGDPLDEVVGVSYGAAVVGDPGATALTIGAASSSVATTAIAAEQSESATTRVTVLFGATREPLPANNGSVTTPPIVLAVTPRANDGLALLAREMQRGLRAPTAPPGGWFSWNELFDAVDETAVRAHVDLVATKLAPVHMPLVEIDDGWEIAWGDWQANAKFPSGMNGVGKAIRDRGLRAGVWLAPFLVDTKSAKAATLDPALFVHDAMGAPIVHKPTGTTKTYYVLDGTNPDAMAVAAKPIADLAAAGFDYFKLDFLYAGALPGARKQAGVTGVQALRQGLATLRTAMGEGAVFDACGAPIFPLLGVADALRIGSDTAYSGLSLNWADIVFAARSTAARAFLSPIVFLDGDQTQVRAPYDDGEARASAFVAALSGPAYALGDDLRKLPPDRLALALDATVLDLAGAPLAAVPDDPLENAADALVASPVLDAVTNPGSTGAQPPTHFTMKGKSGAVHHLTFQWTDVHVVDVQ